MLCLISTRYLDLKNADASAGKNLMLQVKKYWRMKRWPTILVMWVLLISSLLSSNIFNKGVSTGFLTRHMPSSVFTIVRSNERMPKRHEQYHIHLHINARNCCRQDSLFTCLPDSYLLQCVNNYRFLTCRVPILTLHFGILSVNGL